MNSVDAKNVTKLVIETLNEEGILSNKFFDESKFRSRCYRALTTSDIDVEDHKKILELAISVADNIILENFDSTFNSLVDKGIITETKDESGKKVYKLNK